MELIASESLARFLVGDCLYYYWNFVHFRNVSTSFYYTVLNTNV